MRALVCIALLSLTATTVHAGTDPCVGSLTPQNDTTATYDETIVIDVLANDTRPPGLALTLQIVYEAETTCLGAIDIDFDAIVYTPAQPLIRDCQIKYLAWDDRPEPFASAAATLLSGNGILTVQADPPADVIFADSFESGDTSFWSSCAGCQ